MDLRQLEYFVRIVERGSFSSAARELGVAQPALSKRMVTLEAELRTQLLVRTARGAHATESGADFFRHAVAILSQVERARRGAIGEKGAPSGPVAIGMLSSLAPFVGVPLLAEAAAQLPEVRLHIAESLTGDILERVLRGSLDIGVVTNETAPKDMATRALFAEDLFYVSAPGRAKAGALGDTVRLKDIAKEPFVLPSKRLPLREQIERAFLDAGEQIRVVGEFDTVHSLKAAAESGFTAAILPWSALQQAGGNAHLSIARIASPRLTRTAWVCTSTVLPLSPAARAVFELVPAVVRRLIGGRRIAGARLVGRGGAEV